MTNSKKKCNREKAATKENALRENQLSSHPRNIMCAKQLAAVRQQPSKPIPSQLQNLCKRKGESTKLVERYTELLLLRFPSHRNCGCTISRQWTKQPHTRAQQSLYDILMHQTTQQHPATNSNRQKRIDKTCFLLKLAVILYLLPILQRLLFSSRASYRQIN